MVWLKTGLTYAFVTITSGAWGSITKEPHEASHYSDLYKSMIADSCMGANYDFPALFHLQLRCWRSAKALMGKHMGSVK